MFGVEILKKITVLFSLQSGSQTFISLGRALRVNFYFQTVRMEAQVPLGEGDIKLIKTMNIVKHRSQQNNLISVSV